MSPSGQHGNCRSHSDIALFNPKSLGNVATTKFDGIYFAVSESSRDRRYFYMSKVHVRRNRAYIMLSPLKAAGGRQPNMDTSLVLTLIYIYFLGYISSPFCQQWPAVLSALRSFYLLLYQTFMPLFHTYFISYVLLYSSLSEPLSLPINFHLYLLCIYLALYSKCVYMLQ